MRRALWPALAALLVGSVATPVLAQTPVPSTPPTTGSCAFDRSVCAKLGALPPAQPVAPPVAAPAPARPSKTIGLKSAPRAPAAYRWERVPLVGPCLDPVTGRVGLIFQMRHVEIATGRVVEANMTCVPTPAPRPDPTPRSRPEPEVAPPPPERIWSEVPLPEPTWGLNPGKNGLTGLPTWLWDPSGGAPVNATVTLGAFTATATAKPVNYEWKMWDPVDKANRNPDPIVRSTVAGSEAKPAATYMYETTGDFTVTQTVTWAGTYTFTGPGVNEVVDLGTTTTSSSRPYHVIEVRGARVG